MLLLNFILFCSILLFYKLLIMTVILQKIFLLLLIIAVHSRNCTAEVKYTSKEFQVIFCDISYDGIALTLALKYLVINDQSGAIANRISWFLSQKGGPSLTPYRSVDIQPASHQLGDVFQQVFYQFFEDLKPWTLLGYSITARLENKASSSMIAKLITATDVPGPNSQNQVQVNDSKERKEGTAEEKSLKSM